MKINKDPRWGDYEYERSFEQANEIIKKATDYFQFTILPFANKTYKFTEQRIYFSIAFYLLLRLRFGDSYLKEHDTMQYEKKKLNDDKRLDEFGKEVQNICPKQLINSFGFSF